MFTIDIFNIAEMTLRGHPRSSVTTWFDRRCTILEQSTVVTIHLSRTASENQRLIGQNRAMFKASCIWDLVVQWYNGPRSMSSWQDANY